MKRSPIRVLSLILCVALLCSYSQAALFVASPSSNLLAESSQDFPVPKAGAQQNAYTETVSETRTSFTTVKLQPGETLYYHIYGAAGTILTVEDPAAKLILEGKTYTPKYGVVTVALAETADSPLTLQIGNTGKTAAIFTLNFAWAGEPTEPVPTEPVPTEPVPTEPIPTEPVPTDPEPTDPEPTEPDGPKCVEVDFPGPGVPISTVEIPVDGSVIYRIMGNVPGMELTVEDADGFIITYNGVAYTAVDGVITIPVSGNFFAPVELTIANNGSEAASLALVFNFPVGNTNNPAELVLGDNKGTTVADDPDGYNFTYTAEASGQLILQITAGAEDYDLMVSNLTAGRDLANFDFDDNIVVMDVAAGDEILVTFIPYDGWDIPACDFVLNAKLETGEPTVIEISFPGPGTPITTVEIPVGGTVIYRIMGNMPAMELKVENADGFAITYNGETYTAVNGVITVPVSGSYFAPVELTITNNGGAAAAIDLVINFPVGNANNPAQLVLGDNKGTTVADDPDGYNFLYTVEADGTLILQITDGAEDYDLLVSNLTAGRDLANFDFDDNIVVMDVAAGDEILVTFIPYDGWDIPACDFVLNAKLETDEPAVIEIGFPGPGAPITTVEIPVGGSVIYRIMGNMPSMELTAENADGFAISFNGETYTAVDGVITVPVSGSFFAPAELTITNNGTAAAAIHMVIDFPVGNANNPAELVLGSNKGTTVADDPDGYNFLYTVEADGTLILRITDGAEDYDLLVTNNTNGQNLANFDFADNIVVMEVSAGDEILVTFIPYEGWDIPACDFVLSAVLAPAEPQIVELSFPGPGTPFSTGEISAGGVVTYRIMGNLPAMVLTVKNADGFTITFNGETYTAVDGVITVPVSGSYFAPAELTITNTGSAAALELVISFPLGNANNPAELALGNNLGTTVADDPDGYNFLYTAEADGKLYIALAEGAEDYDLLVTNNTNGQNLANFDFADNVVVMDVTAGDEILVTFIPYEGWDIPACDFVLKAVFAPAEPQVVELSFPGPGTPFSTGAIPAGYVMTYRIMGNLPAMVLTAENAGNFVIAFNGDTYTAVDGVITVPVSGSYFAPAELTITNTGAAAALELVISFPLGNANNPAELALGDNKGTTVADDPDGYNFLYTAEKNGTLILQITEGAEDYDLLVSNTTSGQSLANFDFADNAVILEVAAGDEILVTFIPYDGWDIPACDFVLRAEMPEVIEISFAGPGEPFTTAEIPAGGTVIYRIMGNLPAMELTAENADDFQIIHNGETYTAEDGVITAPISGSYFTPAELMITNKGSNNAALELIIDFPVGNANNPAELVLGDNKGTTVADDPDGYNFLYTAEADGTLVLRIAEGAEDYDLLVSNNTKGQSLANFDFADNIVVMEVSAGDEILVTFIPYEGWDIPACDFVLQAELRP